MLKRVIELLASWTGQLGSRNVLEVQKMTHLFLMWCIWRKWNVRSFEDHGISIVEPKTVMLNSLYTWIAVYNSLHFSSFYDFLDCCSSFSP
jgi:hypothetical protein